MLLEAREPDRGELLSSWLQQYGTLTRAIQLSDTLVAHEQGALAVETARGWRETGRGEPARADFLLARMLEQAGPPEEAAKAWIGLSGCDLGTLSDGEPITLGERLLALGRPEEAVRAWPDPCPPGLLARKLMFLCRLGRFEAAQDLLDATELESCELAASQLLALGAASIEAGDRAFAIAALMKAASDPEAEFDTVQRALDRLLPLEAGENLAMRLLTRLQARFEAGDQGGEHLVVLARLAARAGASEVLASLVERIAGTPARSPQAALAQVKVLQQAARPAEALAKADQAFQMDVPEAERAALDRAAAECLAELGQAHDAIERLRRWLGTPYAAWTSQVGLVVARAAGIPGARARFEEAVSRGQKGRLPADLQQALAGFRAQAQREFAPVSPVMAQTWALSGRPKVDWPGWRRAYQFGAAANALLRNWLVYAAPGRQGELDALIAGGDRHVLENALSKGRGVLLAGSHMGPVALTIPYFIGTGVGFSFIGLGGSTIEQAGGIYVSDQTPSQTLRAVRERLRAGELVSVAQDARGPGRPGYLDISGRRFLVSRLVPSLAYAEGAPSLFVHAEWRGAKVHVRIETLPVPGEGETGPAFQTRWLSAYATKLEGVLSGPAENTSNLVLRATGEPADDWFLRALARLGAGRGA